MCPKIEVRVKIVVSGQEKTNLEMSVLHNVIPQLLFVKHCRV